uniref:Legume lectin domain-containing protein n=1 Tax=Oryza brachyantha TaxID=4533 RepID=J3MID0_ORYBR
MDTVDARLAGDYDTGEAELVLKLGLLCSHPFAGAAPPPADLSFDVLAMMQYKGFDTCGGS